jgi:hypothetical protein
MIDTNLAFDAVIENCKTIFIKKTIDYGTSWRVYRILSVADQIYIKAKRIRNIQDGIIQKIDDDVTGEWKGIINYSIIGLIQLEINNDMPEELEVEKLQVMYASKVAAAKDLMQSKNNDYGEAWRDMSQVSFVDLILAKILRIKQIISNDGVTLASEGIDANFYDILNYAVFALILQNEN